MALRFHSTVFHPKVSSTLAFLLFAFSSGAEPIDLRYEDLEKMTRGGNTSISAADLQWRAHERRTGFLLRSFVPRFSVIGGYEYFQTGFYGAKTQPYGGASATLNLFNGFRDYQEGRVRNSRATLSKIESAVVTQEKMSQVRQLYLQLAYFKELERVYDSILKTNERAYRGAKARQNRGLVTSTDLYEFDIHGGQIREEIASLHHEMELYSIKLSAALGIPETRQINPVDLLGHEHYEELVKTDYSTRPTAGKLRIEADENVRMAQASQSASWWLPSIDTYA
jgi:outer membrane protein TolC